jgi:hypothetical protein
VVVVEVDGAAVGAGEDVGSVVAFVPEFVPGVAARIRLTGEVASERLPSRSTALTFRPDSPAGIAKAILKRPPVTGPRASDCQPLLPCPWIRTVACVGTSVAAPLPTTRSGSLASRATTSDSRG